VQGPCYRIYSLRSHRKRYYSSRNVKRQCPSTNCTRDITNFVTSRIQPDCPVFNYLYCDQAIISGEPCIRESRETESNLKISRCYDRDCANFVPTIWYRNGEVPTTKGSHGLTQIVPKNGPPVEFQSRHKMDDLFRRIERGPEVLGPEGPRPRTWVQKLQIPVGVSGGGRSKKLEHWFYATQRQANIRSLQERTARGRKNIYHTREKHYTPQDMLEHQGPFASWRNKHFTYSRINQHAPSTRPSSKTESDQSTLTSGTTERKGGAASGSESGYSYDPAQPRSALPSSAGSEFQQNWPEASFEMNAPYLAPVPSLAGSENQRIYVGTSFETSAASLVASSSARSGYQGPSAGTFSATNPPPSAGSGPQLMYAGTPFETSARSVLASSLAGSDYQDDNSGASNAMDAPYLTGPAQLGGAPYQPALEQGYYGGELLGQQDHLSHISGSQNDPYARSETPTPGRYGRDRASQMSGRQSQGYLSRSDAPSNSGFNTGTSSVESRSTGYTQQSFEQGRYATTPTQGFYGSQSASTVGNDPASRSQTNDSDSNGDEDMQEPVEEELVEEELVQEKGPYSDEIFEADRQSRLYNDPNLRFFER
jgi:hypothetical protein